MERDEIKTLIVGAGRHAKVLLQTLTSLGVEVSGFIDSSAPGTEIIDGKKVLGDDQYLEHCDSQSMRIVNGVGSIIQSSSRRRLYERFKAQGFNFANVIHSTSVVDSDVNLGEGIQLLIHSVINRGCIVGNNTLVNSKALIEHDCVVGGHCHIAPGAVLCGSVVIGEGTHVGANATVIDGINIGANCVIAAGATVFEDIPDNSTYIPGKPLKNDR